VILLFRFFPRIKLFIELSNKRSGLKSSRLYRCHRILAANQVLHAFPGLKGGRGMGGDCWFSAQLEIVDKNSLMAAGYGYRHSKMGKKSDPASR